MKKFAICCLLVAVCPAFAATSRPGVVMQKVAPASFASVNQLTAVNGITTDKTTTQPIVAEPLVPVAPEDRGPDMREHEKEACIRNNIGMGNTFVWASKYSNTNNYASMVEDVNNPQNNICWVKVEIKSSDAKINVSDIRPVYYEMGRTITCGSWADASALRQRILDARKGARTWGTVAGAVGGAGVGVGAMELFGNRMIGGAVEGQKHLERTGQDAALLRSRILTLREKGDAQYGTIKTQIGKLKTECEKWDSNFGDKPKACEEYKPLFDI